MLHLKLTAMCIIYTVTTGAIITKRYLPNYYFIQGMYSQLNTDEILACIH